MGFDGDDLLVGGDGMDSPSGTLREHIAGGSGDDIIYAGKGLNQFVRGGIGSDIFILGEDASQTIEDFSRSDKDKIGLFWGKLSPKDVQVIDISFTPSSRPQFTLVETGQSLLSPVTANFSLSSNIPLENDYTVVVNQPI